jgi:hypothetical protein
MQGSANRLPSVKEYQKGRAGEAPGGTQLREIRSGVAENDGNT